MRRILTASLLLHVAAALLLTLVRWQPAPPPGDPARIDVLFGHGGPPAASAAARTSPAAGTFPSSAAPDSAGRLADANSGAGAPPSRSAASDTPGLRVERPDPTMIAAEDDPGNQQPPYPADAARDHVQGRVLIRMHIDEKGAVAWLEKLASSGDNTLDAAAESALAHWHFRPARRDGVPVPSYRDQPVRFEIQ